jgi:PAS domain S-box-containing protein
MNPGEHRDTEDADGLYHRVTQAIVPAFVRRHYSLKFLVAFLVVVGGVGLVGGVNFVLIQETVNEEATEELRSQATSRALQQSQWVSEMKSQTQLISGTVQPFSLSLRDARGRSSADVVAIHYVNMSKREVVASTEQETSGVTFETIDAPWVGTLDNRSLLRAPVSKVWATNRSYERDTERVVAFTSSTPDGQSAVVLVASNQRIVDQFESTPTLTTAIYTASGHHLFGDHRNISSLDSNALEQAQRTDEPRLRDLTDHQMVYAAVNGTSWVAVTRAAKSDLFQTSNAVGENVISIIATSVFLLLVIGTLLGQHTVVPLNRLRQRAQELADNNFDVDLATARSDEIGQLYADFGMMRDALEEQIQETRQAKEEVEAQRDNLQRVTTRLQLALDETDTGIWEWDLETDEITFDEASQRLFGYEPGDFPGTLEAFGDRVPDQDLAILQKNADEAIESTDEYRVDFRTDPPNSDRRWLLARGVVRYDDDGDPERLLGIQTDITERKEREQELRETKQSLEQSNEKLEQFAGVVSHDLRNPLTVIFGRVEFMSDDVSPDMEDHVDAIERSATRMQDIIDELLALSRAGQEVDQFEAVSLASVAEDSWDTVQSDGVDLDLRVPNRATVPGNPDRLRQVFENLFRNAREHNNSPLTVRVGVLDEAPDDDDGELAGFFVEDDGQGIPEDERDEIFDHGYTTNRDGTGFGLSIVDEVVDAHGWSVSVCTGDSGGARFEIRTDSQETPRERQQSVGTD